MSSFNWPSTSLPSVVQEMAVGNIHPALVPGTTGTYANPSGASVTLTPGIWVVSGGADFVLNTSTTTAIGVALAFTNTGSGSQGSTRMEGLPPTTTANSSLSLPLFYTGQLMTPTTLYFNVSATYSMGQPQVAWSLTAVQIA
jgi:hypothetical protein